MTAETAPHPPKAIEQLLQEHRQQLQERIKELNCLYSISELASNPDLLLPELLQGIVDRIPPGWQFPESACARLVLEDREFKSANFRQSRWHMAVPVLSSNQKLGFLEVGYSEETPWVGAEPFLEEEKRLLGEIAERIGRLVRRKQTEVQDITERKRFEERIRGLSQQLLRGQEDERRRISRELHDVIGQNLSALKVGLDGQLLVLLEEASEAKQKVVELSRLLGETIEVVRDMAHALRPYTLERLGLVKAVLQFCEDFSKKNGIQVDFFSAGVKDATLNGEVRIALYRLIQEGLINIQKHAAADRASIRLVSSYPHLILRVEDNGRGFDVQKRMEAATQEKRLGLSSMEERVSLLGGVMKMDSQPGQGTRIYIEVPVRKPVAEERHGD
ncbi:MAG: sensor histidine kinase [Deltaproteobacteria bacterium]|nr:sensor histidine kinase [Deltaproteobacteria bacterium]